MPARTTISGADPFRPPSRCAHVQSGGSASAATGCGVSVAIAESSSSLGIASTSMDSGRPAVSSSLSDPCATNTQRMRSPARTASSRRFCPSTPAKPSSLRPGLASARRNSFSRAFCLLCTMRIDIPANRQSLRRFYAVLRDVVESTAAFRLLAEALCDSFRLCGIRNARPPWATMFSGTQAVRRCGIRLSSGSWQGGMSREPR